MRNEDIFLCIWFKYNFCYQGVAKKLTVFLSYLDFSKYLHMIIYYLIVIHFDFQLFSIDILQMYLSLFDFPKTKLYLVETIL